MKTPVLITGGAGFIGSHLVDRLLDHKIPVVVLDLLTYAGSLDAASDWHPFSFGRRKSCRQLDCRG